MFDTIQNAFNSLPGELLGAFVYAIIAFVISLIFTKISNIPLLQKQIVLWKATIYALVFSIIVIFVFGIVVTEQLQTDPQNLTSYLKLNLVTDDLDGTDFGWASGNDSQIESPTLVHAELDDIAGQFVYYQVILSSVKDETEYSIAQQIALPQRKLRDSERDNWHTLITTMYIESTEDRVISVIPYLQIPDKSIIYLGFGQTIRTNTWSTVIWRQHAQSMVWKQEFYDELESIRDKYELADVGYIRLSHILAEQKTDGTRLGFEIKMLSEKPVNKVDSISAEIYISSITFLSDS